MPNWDEIRKEYESSKKTLKELAEKYNVKLGTLKSRKSREKWSRGSPKKDATKGKKVASQKKKDATHKKGAPFGNSNAKGNRGNKNASPPKRNTNALKHGFFSKYIPQETLEIMGMLDEKSPADLIWDQIMIQYAAIIRAQQIMFVENEYDMTKEIKKKEKIMSMDSEIEKKEWEIQFAWDKQATFMNAQSRAMSELRSLIKQFNELAHEDDERRLKLEQMQLNIDKTKAKIKEITNESNPDDRTIIINNEDEMRRILNERNQNNRPD
ncbi:phage terminase small subunit [Heyndrickxia coagulans]